MANEEGKRSAEAQSFANEEAAEQMESQLEEGKETTFRGSLTVTFNMIFRENIVLFFIPTCSKSYLLFLLLCKKSNFGLV